MTSSHLKNAQFPQVSPNGLWISVGLVIAVFILEFSTPSEFIFGYLYTAPILLASVRSRRRRTAQITAVAIALTLLNIWIPDPTDVTLATAINRLIAAISLLVTGVLSDRNRHHQEAIAQQQHQIEANQNLMGLREDFTFTLTHDLKTPLLGAIETLKAFQAERFDAISATQRQCTFMPFCISWGYAIALRLSLLLCKIN
jgi:two-component system, NarL family, sensor kinase